MKKLLFFAFATTLFATSCIKNETNISQPDCSIVTTTAPAAEVTALKAYLDSNNITATQDSRGFFYIADSAALTTPKPTPCSTVLVDYKGTLTSGTVFDSSAAPVAFSLSENLIAGWKEALPLVGKNGSITLYLPPSLAYGAAGYPGVIPGNANLIFHIKLYDFN